MTRGLGGISPANIQKYLAGIEYPADKDDLTERARQNNAPQEVMDLIDALPDRDYGGPQEVQKAYPQAEEEDDRRTDRD